MVDFIYMLAAGFVQVWLVSSCLYRTGACCYDWSLCKSHTLPASGVHPRPALEASSGHKSLKRYSSAGPETMHLPPPDYADIDNKEQPNHSPSADTPDQSGNQPKTPVTTTAPHSPGVNENNSTSRPPMVPPPPPPPLPPPIILLEENEETNTKNPETETESNGMVRNNSPDVSHL
ncbi:hypothetical protein OS493_003088 [Desmophyllum pertusum]|uniref:Uncharacterized protein n=1 Tax=Desmophyllum pertusum TaxID=174260 RepID=A0A9W9YGW3_9CNID|nr:hypothetical protein OS493_003088 [Desmophyllum pertusum]